MNYLQALNLCFDSGRLASYCRFTIACVLEMFFEYSHYSHAKEHNHTGILPMVCTQSEPQIYTCYDTIGLLPYDGD